MLIARVSQMLALSCCREMEALQFLVETDGVLVLSHLDNIHSPHRELVGL